MTSSLQPLPFAPTAPLHRLRQRAELLGIVRTFFGSRGYLEVETPLLSRDTCVDAWIDPFDVPVGRETWYLQTSPEFAMKRLLAAGCGPVYQITRSFRRGEAGSRHNPEFTLLEWYRPGDTHVEQMTLTEELIRHVWGATKSWRADGAGRPLPEGAFRRLAYDDAFEEFAGARVLSRTAEELTELARQRKIDVDADGPPLDRDQWLNLLLAHLVEPQLAEQQAVFLHDYPASQAALARIRPGEPAVAERFELYLFGVEVCNGYYELTDADELLERFRQQNEQRERHGLPRLPVDSRLIEAMQAGLPPCAGVALGFDRLLMLACGTEDLCEVLAFPWHRA